MTLPRPRGAVVIALALVAVSCGDGTSAHNDEVAASATAPTPDAAPAADTTRIWVAPETVECVGEAVQDCLQVKTSEDGEWELFYDEIEGFTYVQGTAYVLDVEISEIKDPPADASSLGYRLVRVVESTEG